MRAFLLFVLGLLTTVAFAHPANVPSSLAKVTPDGKVTIRIRFDAIAFATGATPKDADDGAMEDLLDGPEPALRAALDEASKRFREGFSVLDGGEIDGLDFPTVADVRRFLAGNPNPRLPVMLDAEVRAHLPKGSRTISFRYPNTFGVVIQTVEFPYQEPISEPVEPGVQSRGLTIPTAEEVAKLAAAINAPRVVPPMVKAEPKPAVSPVKKTAPPKPDAPVKPEAPQPEKPAVAKPEPVKKPLPPPSEPETVAAAPVQAPPPTSPPPAEPAGSPVKTYLTMGFTHILPEGIDHILFVLGLFLLGTNMKSLVKQITAFTVAHSLTLALATLQVVRLPGRVIEPLIALSIAFVAAENLLSKEVKPRRTAVVFFFGLVHGMGFAEVFADAGLRGSGLITALFSFNLGVELGQLAVVGIALLAVGWFRKDQRYRKVVVVPVSAAIGVLALIWTVERVLGG